MFGKGFNRQSLSPNKKVQVAYIPSTPNNAPPVLIRLCVIASSSPAELNHFNQSFTIRRVL